MSDCDRHMDDCASGRQRPGQDARKQVEEALADETQFLCAQAEVAEVALANLQPSLLGPRLLEVIARAQHYTYGALWRLARSRKEAVVVATVGENTAACLGFRLKLNDPLAVVAQAIRTGQPTFCNHIQQKPLATHPLSQVFHPQALLAVPLMSRNGDVVGAFSFADAINPERFSERDLVRGVILAQQIVQVTESSDLYAQLQRLEERHRVVTESINDALYTVDQDGLVTFGNAALEQLTGYGMEEVLGQPATLFYARGHDALLGRRRKRGIHDESVPPQVEVEVIRKDGGRVPAELSVANLVEQGRIVGRVGVLRDITERKRAAEEEERRRRESEVLAELARTLNASLDLDTVLQRVVEGARELCHSDVAMIAIQDPTSDAMIMRHMIGSHYQGLRGLRIEPGKGAGGQVLVTGHPFRTDDYANDPRLKQAFVDLVKAQGVISLMVVPIRLGARIEGLLYTDNHSPRLFTDHDEAILLQLAEHAAIAIHNAHVYEESERRRRAAESLADVERLLSQSLDPEEVGQCIVESIRGLFGTVSASLLRLDPVSAQFAVLAESGEMNTASGNHMRLAGTTEIVRLAVRKRQPLASTSFLVEARLTRQMKNKAVSEDTSYHSVLAIPLIHQDRVIGALAIIDHPGRVFSQEEIRLAQAFADQAATALENAHLYQEFQRAYDKLAYTQDQLSQAQKMEAVGRLAGGIAHDFNNLLTVIMGRADLVLSRLRGRDQLRRHVGLILSAADTAASLTRQLLAFSRRQVLQPAVIDLNLVVLDVSTMLRWLIGEDIEVIIRLSPELGHITADPGQLEQVLMNLAVNARDAMPHGGRLTIETANVALDETYAHMHLGVQAGHYVRLTVQDSGCGMNIETQTHIFEPFFTTKGPGKGTGLGLSTVYGIVTQSGGYIGVSSAHGQGTTVTIDLPCVEAPLSAPTPNLPQTSPPQGTETVLLVEDEGTVRSVAREVLQMVGYTVLEAASGEEALQRVEQHSGAIDLLVTDVVMPGMNGRELAARLMVNYPAAQVLYLSGYTDEAIAHHGVLQAGIELLHKPFTPDVLARRVREVLDQPTTH
ncbi:MAG TPA: GAF domain-containing protein [Candidatus Tectomicrobia bacterium]